ncbi:MAG: flavin reductase [bacterium]|nr:flavin reductase [bacterium]
MKKVNLDVLAQENAFNLIGQQWMLVAAGSKDKFNMMTASWGGIGWLWNKPVAFLFIRPERYTHEFIERENRLTLSFYDETHRAKLQFCGKNSGRTVDKVKATGLEPVALESGTVTFEQARLTLDCRRLFKTSMTEADFLDKSLLSKWYGNQPGGSLHDVYVVEIESVYAKG